MDIKPGEITDILKREIKDYDREIDVAETGTVLNAGDESLASTASTTLSPVSWLSSTAVCAAWS